MRYIKVFALATLLLSMFAHATTGVYREKSDSTAHQHFERLAFKPSPVIEQLENEANLPGQKKQRISAKNTCARSSLLAMTVEQRVTALQKLPPECIDQQFWSDNEFTRAIYTEAQIDALIRSVQRSAKTYTAATDSGMHQRLEIIRAAYFVADENPDFSLQRDTYPLYDNLVSALKSLTLSPGWYADSDYQSEDVLYEWLYLIYNLQLQHELYNELNTLLDTIDNQYPTHRSWLKNVWRVYDVYSRYKYDSSFQDHVIADAKHLARIERWAFDRKALAIIDYLPHAPLYWLTNNVVAMEGLHQKSTSLIKKALKHFAEKSTWFMTVIDGYGFQEHCQEIAPQFCKEQYRHVLLDEYYPYTYTFENGDFVIRTGLDYARAQKLFFAAQQVKAQFFRLTGNTTPLPGDTNQRVIAYIAHSAEQYDTYQEFLFGLPSDNGGIYIEQDATFYTYDRTPEESTYSLEELFRHEYVHYLESRYQIHGQFNEGEFYSSPHEHWEVEGLAEYLSGATAERGVLKRRSIMERLTRASSHMSLKEIVNSHSGFSVYPYGMLLHSFLAEHYPTAHKTMFQLIRDNKISSYNTVLSRWANNPAMNKKFDEFVNQALEDESDWWEPETIWYPAEKRELTTVGKMASHLNEHSDHTFTCKQTSQTSDLRVKCTSSAQRLSAHSTTERAIDSLLSATKESEINNAAAHVCYPQLHESSATPTLTRMTCESSLGIATTENAPPVINAEADFDLFDGAKGSLKVFVYEPDNQEVTISWQQLDGPEVTFTTPTNEQYVEFTVPFVEQDSQSTFQVTVSDGRYSETDTVKVNITKVDYHPVVFEESYLDILVEYGDSYTHKAKAYSPDGRKITYSWSNYLDYLGEEDYVIEMPPTEGSTFSLDTNDIPYDAFQGKNRLIVTKELIARDGIGFARQLIRFYVSSPETIDFGEDLQEFEFYTDEVINISLEGSSSADGALFYQWQQVNLDYEETYDLKLGKFKGNNLSIDAISLKGRQRAVFEFEVTASDRLSSSTKLVRIYVYNYARPDFGESITVESSLIEFDYNVDEQISLSVNATSSQNQPLSYQWNQSDLDYEESVDLNLGTLSGDTQVIDVSGIPGSAYRATRRIVLHFDVRISDGTSQKTVTVRVYINKP